MKRIQIIDIIEYTLKQKWRWAGHIARMKVDQTLHRMTTKERKDIKGTIKQKLARWHIARKDETGKRQRTIEGVDGGLHPVVDGQSLGDR